MRRADARIGRWWQVGGWKGVHWKLKIQEHSESPWKTGLKLHIQNTKIMASCPIISWQIGKKMERVTDFIFLGSKITADADISQEIIRYLLLGRKAVTNLDSILKSKDITLLTKVYIVKATGFSWIFIGRTDAEAEPPIPWSPDVKSRLH